MTVRSHKPASPPHLIVPLLEHITNVGKEDGSGKNIGTIALAVRARDWRVRERETLRK